MINLKEAIYCVTDQKDIDEIKEKGTPTTWKEAWQDHDGWPYYTTEHGYLYMGVTWKITRDRDNWPIAYRVKG